MTWLRPRARSTPLTVRRPGARMPPTTRAGTYAQVRVENSGANRARSARTSGGRVGISDLASRYANSSPSVDHSIPRR